MLFGEFHAYSSDAGQHYALVRALMDMEGWAASSSTEFGRAAILSAAFPLDGAGVWKLIGSGLIGMTIVAAASVGLFYLAMFVMSSQIDWRAPLFACLATICYALLRGPVFGRMVVNNYFYAGGGLCNRCISTADCTLQITKME